MPSKKSKDDSSYDVDDITDDMTDSFDTDTDQSSTSSHRSSSRKKDDDDEDDVEVTKEFQENVVKFVKMDDLIRQKQAEIKELRDKRVVCEKFILGYLQDVGENVIEITNGKLRRNKADTKVPLSIDIIKKAIEEDVANPATVEKIMKRMDDIRPTSSRVNLKRTSGRESGKGKGKEKKKD